MGDSGPRQGQRVSHLLVGEYASDATIGGSKHGQKAVPGGQQGGEVTGLHFVGQGQAPGPIPASCPHMLGVAYVLRSWSRHTRSTSCCVMPVSKIRLCRRKLLPGMGGQGWRGHFRVASHPLTPTPQGSNRNLPPALAQALLLAWACVFLHLPIPWDPQDRPTRHSHCLESGVTFSISSMKFFRNSVLLSEAFRSLQYSLGMGGGGKKSGLGGLDRAEGRGFPTGLPGYLLRSPGLREGRIILTGYSHSAPCRLPGLSRGRADRRIRVCSL